MSSQLFAAYSKVKSVRNLAAIIGEEELSSIDKIYMKFGEMMEVKFFAQNEDQNRSIEETLDLGWELLRLLPRSELYRIKDELLDKYYETDSKEEN